MATLVDAHTIYTAWEEGPASVIRLFEQTFGQAAVWDPPPPSALQQEVAALRVELAQLNQQLERVKEALRAERHRSFVAKKRVQELAARLKKNSTNTGGPALGRPGGNVR